MEQNSGVKFHEAQVALARKWIGNPSDGVKTQLKAYIKKPDPTGEGVVVQNTKTQMEEVPFPATEEEAQQIIDKFEHGADSVRGDAEVADTVVQHMLRDQTSLLEEKWLGTEEEERSA